jgi:hypothetical protein
MRERFAQIAEGPRATVLDGLVILLGMYMAISPWVVHFRVTNPDVAINNLILGLILAAFGLGLALQPGLYRLGWLCVPVGVWMIISPWVVTIGHSAPRALIWNNVCIGAAAVVLGLAMQGLITTAVRGTGRSRR